MDFCSFSDIRIYKNINQHKISFPLIYNTCVFRDIKFSTNQTVDHISAIMNFGCSHCEINGDFFLEVPNIFPGHCAKFQLYTIFVRVLLLFHPHYYVTKLLILKVIYRMKNENTPLINLWNALQVQIPCLRMKNRLRSEYSSFLLNV